MKMNRKLTALALLAVAALALGACTAKEPATSGSVNIGRNSSPTAPSPAKPAPETAAPSPAAPTPVAPGTQPATPGSGSSSFGGKFEDNVPASAVPAELLNWVQSQRNSNVPAYKFLTVGDATYIAATGGMQKSGGYTLELVNADLPAPGGRPVVTLQLRVKAPAPGSINTTAMTNPVRYFRITPQLVGDVKVLFN